MALSRVSKRTFTAAELGVHPDNFSAGAWYSLLSSGIYSLHKDPAASESVINIPLPRVQRPDYPTQERLGWESKYDLNPIIKSIEVFYKVTGADLSSAPTAVLNKQTYPGDTGSGLVSNAAVTQALTFAGVDAIGIASGADAAGSHIAVVTLTTPTTYAETEAFVLSLTMNEAATSELDIFGIAISFQ